MPDENDKRLWSVYDLNAYEVRDGKPVARIHDVKPGVRYPLTATEAKEMPEEHARIFLKDPAFKVLNADGEEVASLEEAQKSRKPPEALEPGQVIAKLEELTTDALLTRAALLPGGADFTSDTPREQLMDLLLEAHERQANPAAGNDDAIEGDTMPARALDRMFPRDGIPPRPPRGSNVAKIKKASRVTGDAALTGD